MSHVNPFSVVRHVISGHMSQDNLFPVERMFLESHMSHGTCVPNQDVILISPLVVFTFIKINKHRHMSHRKERGAALSFLVGRNE